MSHGSMTWRPSIHPSLHTTSIHPFMLENKENEKENPTRIHLPKPYPPPIAPLRPPSPRRRHRFLPPPSPSLRSSSPSPLPPTSRSSRVPLPRTMLLCSFCGDAAAADYHATSSFQITAATSLRRSTPPYMASPMPYSSRPSPSPIQPNQPAHPAPFLLQESKAAPSPLGSMALLNNGGRGLSPIGAPQLPPPSPLPELLRQHLDPPLLSSTTTFTPTPRFEGGVRGLGQACRRLPH